MSIYEKLDPYQQDAVEFVDIRDAAALFFEQGTGKTWIAGGVLQRRMTRQPATFQALLVVPLTNIDTTWHTMIADELPDLHIGRSLEEFKALPFPRVLLVHYEALPRIIKKVQRLKWSVILYDEAQRLKERATLQSRTAAKLRKCGNLRVILTGTPIESRPVDLWAQFRFLDEDVFGSRWKDFEDDFLEEVDIDLSKYRPGTIRYARMLTAVQIAKRKRTVRDDRMPRFLRRVRPYALRVTKDVLNLPPMTVTPVPIKLRGSQREIYGELEKDLVSRLTARSRVSASFKMTKLGKLHQICGGYVIDDEGDVQKVGTAKLVATRRLVRQSSLPVVIFCRYREEARCLAEEFNYLRVAVLTGKTKRKDRAPMIEAFQAGEYDVLISQIRTGGVGIDLFRSCVAIMYSTTYSFIDFEQAISRVHRRGQTKPVTIFLVFAEGTVDETICEAIVRKRRVSEYVLSRLKTKGEDHVEGRQGSRCAEVRHQRSGRRARDRARVRPRPLPRQGHRQGRQVVRLEHQG